MPSTSQVKKDARAHLDILCGYGYSQLKRGDNYVVVNNRTLEVVDDTPKTLEEAEGIAEKKNIEVKYRMMDVCKEVGFV